MKITFAILFGVLLLFIAGVAYDKYSAPQFTPPPEKAAVETHADTAVTALSEPVPDFSVKTTKGATLAMKDLRGKPVLVNFWATWCAVCITEFPHLIDLIDRYNGKVTLLALSSDTSEEAVAKFLDSLDPAIKAKIEKNPIYIGYDKDRAITHDMFLTVKYPETVFVTKDGIMANKIVGAFEWHGAKVDRLMADLLR